ncbi:MULTISPECIES: hypothetical protein [unclassified Haladaptatus]|uniref:DNA replication complex subunit Gins51 n=1 Tax=unclassified Haladaptatus TaxID=2622732 RepID=UPI0023E7DCD7|nr:MULTISPECIES: hypothetical protein [unclassified Haladaptatus]
MNLDDLQSVRSKERQKDSLQHLRETFYADAAEFIQSLRDEREAAAARADDPFDSPEVRRLSDDIKTAESTVEAVYERRIGKLVKMASLDAAGMPVDDDGLTAEEQGVYETLVTAIEENRAHVLSVLAGEGPQSSDGPEPDADPESEPTKSTGGVSAAEMMGAGDETATDHETQPIPPDEPAPDDPTPEVPPDEPEHPDGNRPDAVEEAEADAVAGDAPTATDGEESPEDADESAADADDERTTVRITKDIGEIFGIDQRTYFLSAEDVVTLPSANAKPLVDRDAAEPLN